MADIYEELEDALEILRLSGVNRPYMGYIGRYASRMRVLTAHLKRCQQTLLSIAEDANEADLIDQPLPIREIV